MKSLSHSVALLSALAILPLLSTRIAANDQSSNTDLYHLINDSQVTLRFSSELAGQQKWDSEGAQQATNYLALGAFRHT